MSLICTFTRREIKEPPLKPGLPRGARRQGIFGLAAGSRRPLSWLSDGCRIQRPAVGSGQLHRELRAFCGQERFLTGSVGDPDGSGRHPGAWLGGGRGRAATRVTRVTRTCF